VVFKAYLGNLKSTRILSGLLVLLGAPCVFSAFMNIDHVHAEDLVVSAPSVLGKITATELQDPVLAAPAAPAKAVLQLDQKKADAGKSTGLAAEGASSSLGYEEAMRQARELAAQGETLSVQPPKTPKLPPKPSFAAKEQNLQLPQQPVKSVEKSVEPAAAPVAKDKPKTKEILAINLDRKALAEKDNDADLLRLAGHTDSLETDLGRATAQKPDMLEPLSLEEAVSSALRNNFEVKASDARTDGAKWDRMGAYSQYMPSAEFTYAEGAEKSTPGSYNGPDGSRVSQTTHHRRDRSLFIRQPILDLVVMADIMKSHDTVSVTDAERRDMQESTAFSTVAAFLKLLQSRKIIELADEYKGSLGGLARRMQARFDAGGATNADVDRIKSRLKVAEASRLEALGTYGSGLSEFKRLTNIVPAQFKAPERFVPVVPSTAQEALDLALKNNPSYLASLIKIDVAQGDRNKSFAGILPKVSVEYSDAFNFNAGGSAHGNPIDGVYPTQEDKRIMLVARWSISGGTALASGMSGAAKVREMKYKSQDMRARLEQGMFTAYDALNAARRRVAVLKEAVASDQRIVNDLEEQFAQGQRSLFELLDSQDRLFNSRIELLRTAFAEAQICYQIRLQMGEIAKAVLTDKAGA